VTKSRAGSREGPARVVSPKGLDQRAGLPGVCSLFARAFAASFAAMMASRSSAGIGPSGGGALLGAALGVDAGAVPLGEVPPTPKASRGLVAWHEQQSESANPAVGITLQSRNRTTFKVP